MELHKGFLQGTVVVIWAVYAVVLVLTGRRGGSAGSPDPTAGTGLVEAYLATLPTDALAVATAAMIVAVVGIEIGFGLLQRAGRR